MPSLKEVKIRINSVQTTRKITQARQMVSSVKLRRAQNVLARASLYHDTLEELMAKVSHALPPLLPADEKTPAAIVVMSSNGGMCGSFNARMIKELHKTARENPGAVFFPVGKKVRTAAKQAGYEVRGDFDSLADKPDFEEATKAGLPLITGFMKGEFSSIEVLYYSFINTSRQDISRITLLPARMPQQEREEDYIIEPSAVRVAEELFPMLFYARLYACAVNNNASEHATRLISMQLATNNADNLLDELRLSYNKLRQQNITSELLDIIGSSFA